MKNFFSVLLKCKQDVYERRDRAAAEVLKVVQRFAESGIYSSCKKAGDIVSLTLRGFDVKTIGEKYNLSPETIRSEKRKISEELWSIFPNDFFDNFVDFNNNRDYFKDFLYSLGEYNSKSGDFILIDVLSKIPAYSDLGSEDYCIEDIRNELDLLLRYSAMFLAEDLKRVDMKKLRYIIDVLDYKIPKSELRVLLLKEFKGD